jgi:hypothetical protein
MDNSSKLKKMKNENNKFMPFLILVPLVLMKLTLMIMKKISLKKIITQIYLVKKRK